MKKFEQTSIKLYYENYDELSKKINELNPSGEFPIHILPSTPDFTTTGYCVKLLYWKLIV